MTRVHPALLAAAALGLALPAPAQSQIRGSERGSVSQTLDGTTITIDYARPVARGRELFGGIVPWNVVWTPGANWATTLEADKDIRLNGVEVPAGRYSVWMIPRPDEWTLTLNPNPEIFHFLKPDSAADQIHVAVQPEESHHSEMLTWSFPQVRGDAAILAMSCTVTEKDGRLRGHLPFPIHPGDELEFDLVPAGLNRFSAGLYRDAKLFNVEMGFTFDFEVMGEHASAVVMRGIEGTAFAEGKRAGMMH
jgi:hypothetical protein